jgi:ATP-dependent Clp protease adaptor protein ClpS
VNVVFKTPSLPSTPPPTSPPATLPKELSFRAAGFDYKVVFEPLGCALTLHGGTMISMESSWPTFSLAGKNSQASPTESVQVDVDSAADEPYIVLLFDDPVNTMNYVSNALRAVLNVDAATAEHLMLEAHTTGKANVFSGAQVEAEKICVDLHGWTLNAAVVR